MPHPNPSAWRVAFIHWVGRIAREVPMYTDEAMAILGLPPTATLDEAKQAFRTMINLHHPDHGGDVVQARNIIEAWEQLKKGITRTRAHRPSPPPSYSRPKPPPPPPRPDPTPPPSKPSSNPEVKVTWQEAERKTKGRSQPEAKDRQRVEDMIKKAMKVPSYAVKLKALAQQMANSIDDVNKALRRGRACEEHADVEGMDAIKVSTISQIFYARAMSLARVSGL